jgi:predicted SAM-dependent methyltransferase
MTRFSWQRPLTSYSKVQRVIAPVLRNRRIQLARARRKGATYLNVGCGSNTHPDYVNLDYAWHPGIDVCWDIRRALPFADASFAGVFTEHCLEHVTHADCLAALKELRRVLRSGGRLRVVLPDGGLYLRLYQAWGEGERVEFPYVDEAGQRDLAEDSRIGFTPMMAVNRIFRGYGHLFAYDAETLAVMLRHCGFREVESCEFRQGRDPRLLIDSEWRRPQSFYMEAVA